MIWSENSLFFKHPDIYGVTFDSRIVKKGDMFVALKGDSFDGHDFVEQALRNGASCALVERVICQNNIVVDSVLNTFIQIAKFRRSLFKNKIIGITGSVGKSTLRASIVQSLSSTFRVDTPIKNYNTLVGLAYFFSQFNLDADYVVVELGVSKFNEMIHLANLALPNIAILLNVFSAHIDTFGSLFEILKEKSNIFVESVESALFCGNMWYSAFLKDLLIKLGISYSCFDYSLSSRVYMKNVAKLLFHLLNVKNQFSVNEIDGRRKILKKRINNCNVSLVNSSYNANLASMIDELKFFQNILSKNKIAILGDMYGHSARHHQVLSLYCEFECWLIGENMFYLFEKLPNARFFKSIEELMVFFNDFLSTVNSDVDFLVKGSNFMKLDMLVECFYKFA